jgi:hypothetical protein
MRPGVGILRIWRMTREPEPDGMMRQFSNCEIHPAREGAEVAPQNHPALSLLELMKAAPVGESPQ